MPKKRTYVLVLCRPRSGARITRIFIVSLILVRLVLGRCYGG
jgi:hypothetical protein